MELIRWNGKPVTKAGCYKGIPIATYHRQAICPGPSVSSSNLRRVLEVNKGSPQHFFNEWSGGAAAEQAEKPFFALGRAAHHLVLGEADFRRHFVSRPPHFSDWRTNASKEWRAQAEAAGLTVITDTDLEAIVGMARSIERTTLRPDDDPVKAIVVQDLLKGEIECSFIWQDKLTGLWCKARPDAVPTLSWTDYVDLKTTSSVADLDLMRSIASFAYHQQAALILEGAKECLGLEIQHCTFTLLFVESKAPYCVRAVAVKQADIAKGMEQNRAARALIARCIRENRWPGPGGWRAIENFGIPPSYYERADYELAEIGRATEAERRAGAVRPKRSTA